MQIHDKPKIYVVGRQVLDCVAMQAFLDDHKTEMPSVAIMDRGESSSKDADLLPEIAGRVCYMSFGSKAGRKDNKEYLGHIMSVGHGSVLEHTVFNFIFTGISRSLTHELIRHRAGFGYSQLSQRYVDSEDADMVLPPVLKTISADKATYLREKIVKHQEQSLKVYDEITDVLAEELTATSQKLYDFGVREGVIVINNGRYEFDVFTAFSDEHFVDQIGKSDVLRDGLLKATRTGRRKAAREAARSVLPNATETKVFVTANARAIRHFLELRGATGADAEIRALACALCKAVKDESPNLFQDFNVEPLPDGTARVTCSYHKV